VTTRHATIGVMKRIGILGGSSDQATADYYRRFNDAARARFGGSNTAELLISSMNFAFVTDCLRHERWQDMEQYLCERAAALEGAGAQILLCVSNTLHRVADSVIAAVDIPFVHIVDPTARAIQRAGLSRVALLGTRPMMSGDQPKLRYTRQFNIDVIVPETGEQDVIDRIIFEELCRGQFTAAARGTYLGIVDRMRTQGAQGVILGCTEIPLLLKQSDRSDLPMFDTAGLHVEAAMQLAVAAD
jgi:aspartate racemase